MLFGSYVLLNVTRLLCRHGAVAQLAMQGLVADTSAAGPWNRVQVSARRVAEVCVAYVQLETGFALLRARQSSIALYAKARPGTA